MNQSQPAQNVKQWLSVATLEVVPKARERIELEIAAHYAEIVRARLADGMSEKDAKAVALLELGNPVEAAEEFRRFYLTIDEKVTIEKWLQLSRSNTISDWVWAAEVLLFCTFFWFSGSHAKDSPVAHWFALSWSGAMLLIIWSATCVIRQMRKSNIRARDFAIRSGTLNLIALFAAQSAIFSIGLERFGIVWWGLMTSVFTLGGCGALIWQLNFGVRRLNKIGASEITLQTE